jgi:hypothetical protein
VNGVSDGFVTGAGLRFNLADNLEGWLGTPDPRLPVVRSDVARYAGVPAMCIGVEE